jgi:site-specific DNA-methyltransferase (adenine-specific)
VKKRASRNRTLTCSEEELSVLTQSLLSIDSQVSLNDIEGKIINQDVFLVAQYLPKKSVNLLIIDPPYNLSKNYNGYLFKAKEKQEYQNWFSFVLDLIKPVLKPTATVYICSDWKTSLLIAPILEETFYIRNRITW